MSFLICRKELEPYTWGKFNSGHAERSGDLTVFAHRTDKGVHVYRQHISNAPVQFTRIDNGNVFFSINERCRQ